MSGAQGRSPKKPINQRREQSGTNRELHQISQLSGGRVLLNGRPHWVIFCAARTSWVGRPWPPRNEKPADVGASTGSEIKAGSFDQSTSTREGLGSRRVARPRRFAKPARQERETVWYVATGKPFVWPLPKPARPADPEPRIEKVYVFEHDPAQFGVAYFYGDGGHAEIDGVGFSEALVVALRVVNDPASPAFGRRIHIGWW